MKKQIIILLLFVFSLTANALDITRVEPSFWWTGMKNSELQIMV